VRFYRNTRNETPQYLLSLGSVITVSIFSVLMSILKITHRRSNEFDIYARISPALKSRAVPKWLIASARLGVNPISNTSSFSILKTSAAAVPWINRSSGP
jgi:hypothetical protein